MAKRNPSVPPSTPQPYAVLRERYPAAIKNVHRVGYVPTDAKHYFDTIDGLRFVVTLDRVPDGRVFTHVVVSAVEHSQWQKFASTEKLWEAVIQTWQSIAQSKQQPAETWSVNGVLNMLIERAN